ncbi:DNA packaging protein [Seohaeicola nanhaiensis]|uniref:DNA packaging protein n=1 Tax=Seohaeicola nanhaiensis TaxID=1387282 RepID=A0ABV9KB11_9RHOB
MTTLADIDAMLADPLVGEPLSASELADWLGLTPNRVHALGRDGVLPRIDGTRYPLRPAILAYCEHARSLAKGKQVDAELASEKLRLAKANAEKAETANAKARGDLIAAVEVEREWAAVLRGVRAAMLALPSRVAQRLGHLSPHDVAEIDREVRDALEELAND